MIGALTLPELCRFFESTLDVDSCDEDSLQDFDSEPRIEGFSLSDRSASACIISFDKYLYSVRASWRLSVDHRVVDIETDCNCSKKSNCLHGAALVFELLRRKGGEGAGSSLSPMVSDALLEIFKRKDTGSRYKNSAISPVKSSEFTASFEDHGRFWFKMELGIVVDGKHHPLLPILVEALGKLNGDYSEQSLNKLNSDGRFIAMLQDGNRVSMPFGRIRTIVRSIVEVFGKAAITDCAQIALTPQQFKSLESRGFSNQVNLEGARRLRSRALDLDKLSCIEPIEAPRSLKADLRPYQKYGVGWLEEISRQRLGGILADDMGLGKTLQVLTHLLRAKESGNLKEPALVVCPKSVVDVWISEAKRFAPSLNVLDLSGPWRERLRSNIENQDLIVTTYGLVSREFDRLKVKRFFAIVADESQNMKNHRSIAARAMKNLTAGHRICLTGTPVENNLTELWSQFDFLIPGLLGDLKSFKGVFVNAGSEDGSSEPVDTLKERIRPFVLRRLKEDVAKELPPKTTIVKSIPLSNEQRDLYEAVRLSTNQVVQAEIASKGIAKSQIQIFSALMKLRQVCCDPGLMLADETTAKITSSKLQQLLDMVKELNQEGRKVIVFSQFTSMLSRIGDALMQEGIEFVELTGSTRDRKTPVDRFQNGEVQVFLISLRAGGSGLTLTAADTVIHYDPWWNPQVENQATDRAYRIGQDKPVFVYKLIARGTIEERIVELQKKKGELARDILDFKSKKAASGLTQDDLDLLLEPAGI